MKPEILHQHGMRDRTKQRQVETLEENLEIVRQCEEAADRVAADFPIAARLLKQEAEQWKGWP